MAEQSYFELAPVDFWTAPWKTRDELLDRFLEPEGYGLHIDAPPAIDLNARSTFPLLVLLTAAQRDACTLSLEDMARVVVVRLEDGAVMVGRAATPQPSWPPMKPVLSQSDDPTAEQLATDLAGQVDVARPGTYITTVLLRERCSNRVRTVVTRPRFGYQDPEVERFLAARRAAPPPPEPATPAGDPFPCWTPVDGSPAVPDAPGISLAIDRVLVAEPGARAVLKGAFRLPLDARARAPGGGAVVPVHLLVTCSDDDGVREVSLRVPAAEAGAHATGRFAIDLLAEHPELASRAHTCFVYALSGEHMSAPALVGVVTPDLL